MSAKEHIVLYVDDERANRVVFEHAFKERFCIQCCASATDALDVLKEHPVAVLVTDQRMPGMSGNELLERTKALYPSTVRVVITAYGDLDPILRAVNDGLVARYVVKPWRRQELEQILTWAVEAYALGEHNSALQMRLLQTERLVTLGSIGATVIHDINQPLSYMKTNAQRLQTLTEGMPAFKRLLAAHAQSLEPKDQTLLHDLAEELVPIVEDLTAGCNVMQGVTSTIRRLLRPTTPSEPRLADPLAVVRYALSVCQEIALKARGKILYDGPAELPKVQMGATELTQVLINVVANAAQAVGRRPERGGRVVVSATPLTEAVRFVVTDDGPGMSRDVLARVGTPFFSTRAEGTGLGVAQCRRLIEREGGEFVIESRENIGTTVRFSVPRAE